MLGKFSAADPCADHCYFSKAEYFRSTAIELGGATSGVALGLNECLGRLAAKEMMEEPVVNQMFLVLDLEQVV
jgi:hypothetical protein